MATPAQVEANRRNSERSTGPTSEAGKEASSRNNLKHGLCHTEQFFFILPDEDGEKFAELAASLQDQHAPQDTTESILVRRMAESEWLRARAVRYQTKCLFTAPFHPDPHFALYIRYQTTHERAFYKALNEFQKLRKEKTKAEIGFDSQTLKQAAETRAVEALNLKKEVHNLKKEEFEFKRTAVQTKNERIETARTVEVSPGGLEIAA